MMIPGSWKGKRVALVLKRVHWETKVWIDGKLVPGTQDSLIAPHVHDLGTVGGTRRLTIRVDNTRKIDLGGFVSILFEGTQTNWNGLVGSMEIRAVDPVAIDDLQVYPDLERKRVKVQTAKYSGVLAARNFELVRADLEAKHLLDLAPRFVQATGRHAAFLYKEEIEVLLRTPKYAGFSLLDLHDYPGQGTALTGLLDPFWDSKGFVTPAAHSRYCGPTVPLLRMPRRIYTTDEPFVAEADLAHYGPAPLPALVPTWMIRDDRGHEVASGTLESRSIPTGELTHLGTVHAPLTSAPAPCRLTVALALSGTEFANAWEIWAYPPGSPEPPTGGLVSAATGMTPRRPLWRPASPS